MDEEYKQLLSDLRKFRRNSELTQAVFAGKLGLSQSYYVALEQGTKPINAKLLSKIKEATGFQIAAPIIENNQSGWQYCPHCGNPLK